MKRIFSFIFIGGLGFFLGFYVSNVFDREEGVTQPAFIDTLSQVTHEHLELKGSPQQQGEVQSDPQFDGRSSTLPTPLFSSVSGPLIYAAIERSSEEELFQTLGKIFNTDDISEDIDDIKVFAHRVASELKSEGNALHPDSTAQLYFSLSESFPEEAAHYFEVRRRQTIYAHIDVSSGLGLGEQKYFTRWLNLQTGEILLFKQKWMDPSSSKNWISFRPDNVWQDGAYEVTFYQFNSELSPLVKQSFYLTVLPR